jgi:integrase
VGIITLKDARKAAKLKLADYTLGKDKPRSKGWETAVEEFLREKGAKRRSSTIASYRRRLGHFRFGPMQLDELRPHDLQKVLDKLQDRPSELHHAFIAAKVFCRWAYRKHYLDQNPLERMETPDPSSSRERILTDAELRKVWKAAPDDPFGRIVRLLILCGQRPGETGRLHGCKREGDLLTIPGSLAKNGRDHTFPIPKMAEQYLHDLDYGGFSKAKGRLDKASGVAGYTLHDLRRTLRSKWAELGISREVAERYINHVSGVHSGVSAVYDRYTYLKEMRAAVATYERWLQKTLRIC